MSLCVFQYRAYHSIWVLIPDLERSWVVVVVGAPLPVRTYAAHVYPALCLRQWNNMQGWNNNTTASEDWTTTLLVSVQRRLWMPKMYMYCMHNWLWVQTNVWTLNFFSSVSINTNNLYVCINCTDSISFHILSFYILSYALSYILLKSGLIHFDYVKQLKAHLMFKSVFICLSFL